MIHQKKSNQEMYGEQKDIMSNNKQFLGAYPILPVVNVIDATRFYVDLLGFEVEVLWKEPPYGVVTRGQACIEFGEGRKQFAGSGVCSILVSNVDAVYAEYLAKEIEFIGDIADRDYGSRDFRIKR